MVQAGSTPARPANRGGKMNVEEIVRMMEDATN